MFTIPEIFLSQVHNTQEVHTTGQFPDIEIAQFNSSTSRSLSTGRRKARGVIIVIGSFLAMVNILSGMMASEGKGWVLMFVCVFVLWLILLPIRLVLYTGMKSLGIVDITKSTLRHLGCCILMFYFFSSILQIPPKLIPRYVPTILDCGLGLGIGMQNLPRESLENLKNWATEVASSLCGGS